MTFNQLEQRAENFGMMIRKVRGEELYMLVDIRRNFVCTHPAELPLDRIERWLDDYEKAQTKGLQNPDDPRIEYARNKLADVTLAE